MVEGKVKPKAERNVRAKQPIFGREVYYHKASLCSVEEVKKKEEVPEANTDYKFVKATQKYQIYAVADKKFPIKPVFEYHGLKEDKDKIVVNGNLKLTKFPKYPEFEKVAGEDTIENLKFP